MVKVKLTGLKAFESRGQWYVYRRSTGEPLIKGFEGDKAALLKHMESPEFIRLYNHKRAAERRAAEYGGDTLGGLVQWYTNGDIDRLRDPKHLDEPGALPDGYPKWPKLSKATRKDYLAGFDWLRPEFDIPLTDITQPDLISLQDKCSIKKWPRFADKMVSALSSMFTQGVRRGKGGMKINPCLGMEKIHQADPNANREWYPEELEFAIGAAPLEIQIALMLARYAGLRGQTIVVVNRKQYRDHPKTGKCFRFGTKKNNDEGGFVPVLPELQDFLARLTVRNASGIIALRDDGTPWENEVDIQTRVSHWLRDREREGLIGAGTTLHGLRVSYAAWWKREGGATDAEVADLLNDKSERMGKHYTRHVTKEQNVVRAFERMKDK